MQGRCMHQVSAWTLFARRIGADTGCTDVACCQSTVYSPVRDSPSNSIRPVGRPDRRHVAERYLGVGSRRCRMHYIGYDREDTTGFQGESATNCATSAATFEASTYRSATCPPDSCSQPGHSRQPAGAQGGTGGTRGCTCAQEEPIGDGLLVQQLARAPELLAQRVRLLLQRALQRGRHLGSVVVVLPVTALPVLRLLHHDCDLLDAPAAIVVRVDMVQNLHTTRPVSV